MSEGKKGSEEGCIRDTGRRKRRFLFYLSGHGDAVKTLLGLSYEAQLTHSNYHILRASLRCVSHGLAIEDVIRKIKS